MNKVPPEQLALEIEDIIKTMPSQRDFQVNPDKCVQWLGRAGAAMSAWDFVKASTSFEPVVVALSMSRGVDIPTTIRRALVLLHQAKNDLRLASTGPLSVGIDAGKVFEYFDQLRQIIEAAKTDILFVDPYIDAEFVSRYLPYITNETRVRILTRERMSVLHPAVGAFTAQTGRKVEVRNGSKFHDRLVFVDGLIGFQSGASFSDGARKTPTTLIQITDAFGAVLDMYERKWEQSPAF